MPANPFTDPTFEHLCQSSARRSKQPDTSPRRSAPTFPTCRCRQTA